MPDADRPRSSVNVLAMPDLKNDDDEQPVGHAV